MKRFLLMMTAVCSLTAAAQDRDKSVTLDEVTVKGARTIQKVDGRWIYPTKQQIVNSANGYSLLAKLTLPHIRVDEAQPSSYQRAYRCLNHGAGLWIIIM